jgi:hypothetical protein
MMMNKDISTFFSNNYGKYYFLNCDKTTKRPCNGYTGYGIKDWNCKNGNQYIRNILQHFKLEKTDEYGYGIKCGEQPNGDFIIGLDFDIYGKNGDEVEHHEQAEKHFNEFININIDGVWSSGTEGNYGCLVKLSNVDLIEKIKTLGDKIEVDSVELLFNTFFVLPPSASMCKRNKILREREYMNDNEPLLHSTIETDKYIEDLINKFNGGDINQIINNSKPKVQKTIKQNTPVESIEKTDTPTTLTFEYVSNKIYDMVDIIDMKFIDNYNDWLKLLSSIKSNDEWTDEDNYKLAGYMSKKSKKFDEAYFKNLWYGLEAGKKGMSINTLYDIAKKSNEDDFKSVNNKWYLNKPLINKDEEEEKEEEEEVMSIEKLDNIKVDTESTTTAEMEFYDKLNKTEQKKLDKKVKDEEKTKLKQLITEKLDYFEKFHFKVRHPASFGRVAYGKTNLIKPSELKHNYENLFINDKLLIDYWKKSKTIKTYENVDFLPHPAPCPKYVFNTFRGLRASKIKQKPAETSNIDIFLNHMKILTGHETASYEYLLNYMAQLVQQPGALSRVSLVFRSKQGVGKNVFFELFGARVLGEEFTLQTASMDHVIGRFSMIDNKLLVILDETQAKDSFSNSDKIKNIITAENVVWEQKGIDPVKIRNCGRYIIFSNNNTPVKIEIGDRRFVVYECADDCRNNKEYFQQLISAFKDDETVKAFYDYLMSIDISKWDSIRDRPLTKVYKNIQSANIPVIARFLDSHLQTVYDGAKTCNIYSSKFFDDFKEFCSKCKFKHDYNATRFGRELIEYDGVEKKRSSKGNVYIINIEKLKQYLSDNGFVEELETIEDYEETESDEE